MSDSDTRSRSAVLGTGPTVPTPPPAPELRLVSTTDCARRIWGAASGLRCMRPANHAGAHVYLDPHGSDVNDRHLDGGHG